MISNAITFSISGPPKASILKKVPRPKSQLELEPSTNYVKVDKVTEEPELDGEEGIVCGSLTLTGEWPKNLKKIRAVTSDGEDENDEDEIEDFEVESERKT